MLILCFSQNRSHFPDHTRHVAIAQVNQVALQRSLHIDVVHRKQAWRMTVKHRTLDHDAPRCRSSDKTESTLPDPPVELFGFCSSCTRRPRDDAMEAALTRLAFSSSTWFRMPLIAALRINSVFHSAMWPL